MVNARPHDPDTTKALNINVLPLCANSCGEPEIEDGPMSNDYLDYERKGAKRLGATR